MNCEKSEPIAFLLFFCFFVLSVNYNDLPQLLHKYINGIIIFFFFLRILLTGVLLNLLSVGFFFFFFSVYLQNFQLKINYYL